MGPAKRKDKGDQKQDLWRGRGVGDQTKEQSSRGWSMWMGSHLAAREQSPPALACGH